MAKKTARRTVKQAWSEIAKEEKAAIGAATKAVEGMPAPADMVDRAMTFAVKTLRSQRDALVPLLRGVTPKGRRGARLPSAAAAVSAAYDLAEQVVETQRKLLLGLIERVTPPLARPAARARTAAKTVRAHPVTRRRVVARRGARKAAA